MQETADLRRKPKVFAENRRKPQIGLCHLELGPNLGIRRISDVRALARTRPWSMELEAANTAKTKHIAGILVRPLNNRIRLSNSLYSFVACLDQLAAKHHHWRPIWSLIFAIACLPREMSHVSKGNGTWGLQRCGKPDSMWCMCSRMCT